MISNASSQVLPWFLAIRPKTLLASFPPILIAAAYAKYEKGHFDFSIISLSFIVLLLFHAAVNIINDALDFKKGADGDKRMGPLRVTSSGLLDSRQVLQGGIILIILAFFFSIPLIIIGGWVVAFSVFLASLATYGYTGGPFPLSYKGFGDLFVLLFFGFMATLLPYYIIQKSINLDIFIASLQSGLLAVSIIIVNNLRDVNEDKLSGKKTIPVRFGPFLGRVEFGFCLLMPYFLNFYWLKSGFYFAGLFSFLTLPLACYLLKQVVKKPPSPLYNNYLAQAAFNNLLFGMGLSVGFIIGR